MRLLIVDDSCPFRQAARSLLERRGYQVIGEAGDAATALERAAALSPAGVLMDVTLPDGTGFAVTQRLTERCPAVAVLLTSAEDFGAAHPLVEQSGACGFVLKSELAACDLTRFWPLQPEPTF